jgi:hypothetical protein
MVLENGGTREMEAPEQEVVLSWGSDGTEYWVPGPRPEPGSAASRHGKGTENVRPEWECLQFLRVKPSIFGDESTIGQILDVILRW